MCGRCGLDCEVGATTPVAWDEQTALGSPAQLFSSFAGTCQAPFAWDASGWGTSLTVAPRQGQSTVTVTVALDPASARLQTREPASCPDVLLIDGVATLDLPEGKVADRQPFTLSATGGSAPAALTFTIKEADFGAWVSVQKSDPSSTVAMSVMVTDLGRACSGEVGLRTEVVHDGIGSGAGGPLASWSDTGCGTGTTGVSLGQPWRGTDLVAAIASSYGQATWSGAWSDGTATTLALAAAPAAVVACAETLANGMSVLTIPVDVVASSADARVQGLTGRGTVRINVSQTTLWDQQLNMSTDLVCATEAEALPYTGASCATTRKVTAQLHLNRYMTDASADGGSLELYVYQRQSPQAGAAAADRVERLTLVP